MDDLIYLDDEILIILLKYYIYIYIYTKFNNIIIAHHRDKLGHDELCIYIGLAGYGNLFLSY